MDDLQQLAAEMREYAFARLFDPLNADRSTISRYQRLISWKAVEVLATFTYLKAGRISAANFSCRNAVEDVDLPQEVIDDLIAAFFHPSDVVRHMPRGTRRLAFAALEFDASVVGKTDQYVVLDPKMGVLSK